MTTESPSPTLPSVSGPERPRWSPSLTAAWWLTCLSPVALLVGMFGSMGDPATTFGLAATLAIPGAICSVVGFATTHRWYALIPAALVSIAAVLVGVGFRTDAREVATGIDPHVVAVTIAADSSETPECLVAPLDLVVAAGDHVLLVRAPAGTTVSLAGPSPSTELVSTYTVMDDSDGVGPSVRLAAGAYTVTCTSTSGSATTELNVGP